MGSSLFGVLGVARDGLMAQTAGLATTGQNVSNANTPGYVRRSALLSARAMPQGSDGGVQVDGIARSFNRFTFAQVVTEHGRRESANARSNALGEAESILAPQSGGISDRVNGFFSSVSALSSLPEDPSARADVLAKATDLAQSISGAAANLNTTRDGLRTQAVGIAGEVNQKLALIATLNTQIMQAKAQGDTAADLRDARDIAVQDVSDRIGARAVEDDKGNVTLFGAGTVLVDQGKASSLEVSVDASNNLKVVAQQPGGSAVDVTSQVVDGSLGGTREARDTDIPASMQKLDQFAYDISNAVNAVHSTGVGLDGASGRPLFTPAATVTGAALAMAVDPSVAGQPDRVAAAANAGELPGGGGAALRLAQLAASPLGAGGSPSERVASLLADVGSRKQSADTELQLRQDTVTQAETLNSSSSGVSLDEEMVNLTRFQRGFDASSKVLQTANELLDGLMKSL